MKQVKHVISFPLMGEAETEANGWSKMTVTYVLENQSKIKKSILGAARRCRNNVQTADVEDIYADVVEYMLKAEDYNVNKAIDRSKSGEMASLEGYVASCVKFCTLRACQELNNYAKKTVSETVSGEDDSELSIFDSIADPRSEFDLDEFDYDLRTLCDNYEPIRYRFGPDLYLVWYVRLLTIVKECPDKFLSMLDLLEITDKDIIKLKHDYENNMMTSIAKAVSLTSIEESLDIIKDYVFSADTISKVISEM